MKEQTPPRDRRYSGLRALSAPLATITRPLFRRRGLGTADIVARWADIVGADLAANSMPRKYVPDRQGGGTLHIRVAGAWAPEFQHLEPQIVERINTHFGYRAVSRLALVQGPVTRPGGCAQEGGRDVPIAAEPADPTAIDAIGDDDLRRDLHLLGRMVRGHNLAKKS